MKFESLVPMLWTDDLAGTIAFYCDKLSFTCGEYNEDWGWAALHRDSCEIMFARPNAHTPFVKPTFTGSFYIKVDDVEPLWNQLKDTVTIVYDLETFDWGMKEFAIYDLNGYMLQIGQEIIIDE